MITNDIIIVTLHYFGWQVMPEYHWNHWIDPIVFPYILPITQIALTGDLVTNCHKLSHMVTYCHKLSHIVTILSHIVTLLSQYCQNMSKLHPPHHLNCQLHIGQEEC